MYRGCNKKRSGGVKNVGGVYMNKIICLTVLCSVLGGCVATVAPRGELYASYRVPVRKVYVQRPGPARHRIHHPRFHAGPAHRRRAPRAYF